MPEIIEDLESNPNIKHVEALIWVEAVNIEYPQNLLIKPLKNNDDPKNNQRPAYVDFNQSQIEIDEIDRKIASILSIKSRIPFSEIAQQLGLTTKTVIQRYKKLRERCLTLSTITLDLNKLGYRALANLYLKTSDRSKINEIYSQLLQVPNLIVVIRLIGSYDLYASVVLEDFNNLFEVTEQIGKINGLERPDVFVTPLPPSWPLNLFASLLESENMPKYWSVKPHEKQEKARANLGLIVKSIFEK